MPPPIKKCPKTVALRTAAALALAALAAFCSGCRSSSPTIADPALPPPAPSQAFAADQGSAPLLPDPRLTPGATLPVTQGDICVPGYTKKVRNVPLDVKRQVYAEYGIAHHRAGEYEVDHLISLELGGSNSIKNLWPQSYQTQPWNAHVKDDLENELHDEICRGRIGMATVQREIATDWIKAYKKHFHTTVPLAQSGAFPTGRSHRHSRHPLTDGAIPFPPAPPQPSPSRPVVTMPSGAAINAQVWVNLGSGKYFRPGSRYYGHTKRGQFMSEEDAQRQGYVAARG